MSRSRGFTSAPAPKTGGWSWDGFAGTRLSTPPTGTFVWRLKAPRATPGPTRFRVWSACNFDTEIPIHHNHGEPRIQAQYNVHRGWRGWVQVSGRVGQGFSLVSELPTSSHTALGNMFHLYFARCQSFDMTRSLRAPIGLFSPSSFTAMLVQA